MHADVLAGRWAVEFECKLQYSIVQYSTVLYNTLQYSTVYRRPYSTFMIYTVYQHVVKHIHRAYFAGNQIQATFLKMTNIHLGHHSSGLPYRPQTEGSAYYKRLSGVASSHLSVSVCLVDRLTRSTVQVFCIRWTSGKYNPLFV